MFFSRSVLNLATAVCVGSLIVSSSALAERRFEGDGQERFSAEEVVALFDYLQDSQAQDPKTQEKKIACGAGESVAALNHEYKTEKTVRVIGTYWSSTECKNAGQSPAERETLCKAKADEQIQKVAAEINAAAERNCVEELNRQAAPIKCDQNIEVDGKKCDPAKLNVEKHCVKKPKEDLACKVAEGSKPTSAFKSSAYNDCKFQQGRYFLHVDCTMSVSATASGQGTIACSDCER